MLIHAHKAHSPGGENDNNSKNISGNNCSCIGNRGHLLSAWCALSSLYTWSHLILIINQIRSDQSLSHVRLFATPWIAARQATLSITNSRSSLRLTSIESVMPSSYLILCRPFFSCPQSLPASESFPMNQLFTWGGQSTGVSALHIIPSKEIPGLISFRMDWLDLLAVQGTLNLCSLRY